MGFTYDEISSRKKEKIGWASKLKDKKHRDREDIFFVEGEKLLCEVILSGLCVQRLFFTRTALESFSDTIEKACAKENYLITDEVLQKITDENSPQGIFACVRKPLPLPFDDIQQKDGGFIILEDIQNPQNIGAIFRCAFSLGCPNIVLSKGCADIYGPKCQRAAMGSILKCHIYICDDISGFIEKQKTLGNRVFCTHLHSSSHVLGEFLFKKGDSIVIGNEGNGVSQKTVDVCTGSVIIPMAQNAESLNAATAASILIWEMNKARQ